MKQFRSILITIIILIVGGLFSMFKKKIGLGFVSDYSMITFLAALVLILSIVSIIYSIKKFNKKDSKSYLSTILTLGILSICVYGFFNQLKSKLNHALVVKEFDLEQFEQINIPNNTSLKIISYTNTYDCTTEDLLLFSCLS